MRCPDPLCEGPSPDCACALRAAAQPLGTFGLFRTVLSQLEPHRYGRGLAPFTWNGLRCQWYYARFWVHELDVSIGPVASLSRVDRLCPICSGEIRTGEDWIVR